MKITDRGRNQQNNNNSRIVRFSQSSQQQNQNVAPWNSNFNTATPFFMLEPRLEQRNDFQQFQLAANDLYQQIPKTVFTIHCGEIRPRDEGTRVKISGKVVKRPRTGRFLEIKDLKGCTQLVATDDKPEISQRFQLIPADAYITVIGKVQVRPSNFINNVSQKIRTMFYFNILKSRYST